MTKLAAAGASHRKFLRMIHVSMDILAPLYWWKEFDTYKIGTVANSCSTMHKITDKEFVWEDFSFEHLANYAGRPPEGLEGTIEAEAPYSHAWVASLVMASLNGARERYINYQERGPGYTRQAKEAWWQMIQLLPTSYNQLRTVDLNYEVIRAQYGDRRNHKLQEWVEQNNPIEFVKKDNGYYRYKIGGSFVNVLYPANTYSSMVEPFKIIPYGAGFIVDFGDLAQNGPAPIIPPDKLSLTYDKTQRWLKNINIELVADVNAYVDDGKGLEIVCMAEALQEKELSDIADMILNNIVLELLFICCF